MCGVCCRSMCMLVCICMCTCMCMCTCDGMWCVFVYVYTGMYQSMWTYLPLSMRVCLCVNSNTDSLMRSEPSNGRPGFIFAEDSIHMWFEHRHTRWFRDPYRYMQYRPDGDSDPRPRHLMWVFVYWSILISTFYLIVSCECIYDFCIILFIPTIIVIPCTLILFYWYIIYCVTNNVIDSFRYSWQMNIGHDFPY